MRMNPYWKGLLAAWLLVSAAIAPALTALFVLPSATVLRLAPVCQRKARHSRECALCGMSHAFVSIARGDFRAAAAENRGSLPLFGGLALNELAAAFLCPRIIRAFRRHTIAGSGRRPPPALGR